MDQYIDSFGFIKSYNPEVANVTLLINDLTKVFSKTHNIVHDKNGPNWLDIYSVDTTTNKHDGFYMIIYKNNLVTLKNYKQGKNHGRIYKWFANGQRKSESIFIDDYPHGYMTSWNEYQEIIEITRYDNGAFDGFNIEYDPETDHLENLSRYRQTAY